MNLPPDRSADAPAFLSPAGVVTHTETEERQSKVAGFLRGRGLTSGDRVAVLGSNRREVIEIVMGALRSGVIPVMINPLLTAPEIDYILEDSQAAVLFTDGEHDSDVPVPHLVTFGDAFERCIYEAEPGPLAETMLSRPMLYTSGTTGRPKGVYVAPMDGGRALEVSLRFRRMWDLRSDDVHLVCSPLAHSAPLRYSTRTLEAGGAVVVLPRFDAEEALAAIELFGVTSSFMVPSHLQRILALGRRKISGFDLGSMRLLCHAGAPMPEHLKRETLKIFPAGSVWEFYGATEGQATRISADEWLRRPGSVGQPHPGARVYVMSESFEKMPPGEVGDIWVLDDDAEPWSYWRDDEKTASAWRDGAFTVGDLGYLDEDGYLYLTGRRHDTIISGGVNVYPKEVEEALLSHPEVADAVVFGVPNESWGQEVAARVVLAAGADLDGAALEAWARERLAAYKCPRRFEFVDELERSPTGKVKRPVYPPPS